MNPQEFLKKLVEIQSVSGNETEAAEFAVAEMKRLGYREAYVDAAGSPIGRWGNPAATRKFMLLGHIDTVPGVIPVRVDENNILHGRGSVDAKGPLATFIQAVAKLDTSIDTEFIVVGAVEEEAATSKGARNILETFNEPEAVFIGEPSNTNGITLGYKGRLIGEFTHSQPMTHTAHAYTSAAERAILFHDLVKNYVERCNQNKKGIFSPLDYTVRSLNTDSDGLSESVRMVFSFRLGPDFCPKEIDSYLQDQLGSTPELKEASLGFRGHEKPAQYDKKNILARALRVEIRKQGLNPRTLLKTGTSDMNVLATKWDCPMVAYGPGDSALDHTPEEHLPLDDFEQAINILYSTLLRLL